jgi:phenylpropionate dioxygenase-like ring-hydroxylating dioxygenase large terminal subunit
MRQVLHPSSFSDPHFAALEHQHLFAKQWQLVATLDELPPRTHRRVQLAGRDWLLRRGADGAVRCFLNVCPHRGAQLCSAARGEGKLQCAYHGWSFSDDGALLGIPFEETFQGGVPPTLHLTEARVELLGPAVFVNPERAAPSLAEVLGPLHVPLRPLFEAMGPLLHRHTVDIAANWKVVMENALETSHVAFVHRESIHPLGFEVTGTDHHAGSSLSRYSAPPNQTRKTKALALAFPDRPVLLHGYLHANLFPNSTVATAYGSFFLLTRTEPVTPSTTRLHWFFHATTCGPRSPEQLELATTIDDANIAFVRRTLEEDAAICPSVHEGTWQLPERGYLSTRDDRLLGFERQLVACLPVETGSFPQHGGSP